MRTLGAVHLLERRGAPFASGAEDQVSIQLSPPLEQNEQLTHAVRAQLYCGHSSTALELFFARSWALNPTTKM